MNSMIRRWPLWFLLQGVVFAVFYSFALSTGEGTSSSSPVGAFPTIALGTPQHATKPAPLPSMRSGAPLSHPPETGNKFEETLDKLLEGGDYLAARALVFSQQDRSEANRVFARKLVNYLHDLEAIRTILRDVSRIDRLQICSTLLFSVDKPFDLLHSLQDVFPQGLHLNGMLQSYMQLASESRVPELLEFVNTMPDSPLRQTLILEALVKRGFEDLASVEQALTLLPSHKARARYVKALRQSTYFRDLDEAARAAYSPILDRFPDTADN